MTRLRLGGRFGRWKITSPPYAFGTKINAICVNCEVEREVVVEKLLRGKRIGCKCAQRTANRKFKRKQPDYGVRPKFKPRVYPELSSVFLTDGVCFYGDVLLVNRDSLTQYIFSQWIGYKDKIPFITVRFEKERTVSGRYSIFVDSALDILKLCYEMNITNPVIFSSFNVEPLLVKQMDDVTSLMVTKVQPEFRRYDNTKPPYYVFKEVLKERAEDFKTRLYTKKFYNDWSELTEAE